MSDLVLGVVGAGFLVLQPLVAQQEPGTGLALWALAGGMAAVVAAAFLRLAPVIGASTRPGVGEGPPSAGRPTLAAVPGRSGRWATPLYLTGFLGGTTAFALLTARLTWRAVVGPDVAATPGSSVAAVTVTAATVTAVTAGLAWLLRRRPLRPAQQRLRFAAVVAVTVAVPSAPLAAAVLAPAPPPAVVLLVLPLAVTVVGLEPCLTGGFTGRHVARAVVAVTVLQLAVAVVVGPWARPVGSTHHLPEGGWADRAVALACAVLLVTYVAGNLNAVERFATSSGGVATWRRRSLALLALTAAVTGGLLQSWHQVWLLSVPGACTTALYLMAIRSALLNGTGRPRPAPESVPR